MIRVGIAGIGFMGWTHYQAYEQIEGISLAAIAERDEKRRSGDWTDIQGNFGPPGRQIDLTGIGAYESYEDMLNDPNVDLVDLCLPPNLHAKATVAALEAGKHVFVEKPMALKAEDCQQMVDAAEKTGKHLFVGHVLPLLPEYDWAYKAATSGEYGKPLGGVFKRTISDPTWLKNFYDPDLIGGPLLDLHVHDAHFIRLLFGQPKSVFTQGRFRGEVVEYCHSHFQFENPDLVVTSLSGVINQQGRTFTHGFELHLEEATLQFELAVLAGGEIEAMPAKLLNKAGEVLRPALGDGDMLVAFKNEIAHIVNCLKENKPSEFLNAELARDAIRICQAEAKSAAERGLVDL